MHLEFNKTYWVLIDPHIIIRRDKVLRKKDFERLIRAKYEDIKNDDISNVHHIFSPCKQINKHIVVLPDINMSHRVFNNQNEYLSYLVRLVSNDKDIVFDDFMVEKIDESQKKFPEFWI